MSLRLERLHARALALGDRTGFKAGRLEVDAAGLAGHLRDDHRRIRGVEIALASPGDSTRILGCKDVVQPRVRIGGGEPGTGVVRLLDNVAVVTCGPIVGFQEGIIDLSGPGAAYTPFSELHLIVVEIEVEADLTPHEHEATVREAGIAAARFVAAGCAEVEPDGVEEFLWDEQTVPESLPRVAYLDMLLSQGLLHDTWVLGANAHAGLPRVFDPRVLLDDGVISGNCVSACDKNTTFHHQNNPVIRLLLDGHGTRWNFVGVVATNIPTRLAEKERSARAAVALAAELDAQGAIVSKEGFGNPDADLMMMLKGLEEAGIRCVAITDEFAGRDGASQSLADVTSEADAVISTGNANQPIELPAMETVIGPLPDVARLAGGYAGSLRPDGSMEVELQAIMGATNQLGFSRLSCRGI